MSRRARTVRVSAWWLAAVALVLTSGTRLAVSAQDVRVPGLATDARLKPGPTTAAATLSQYCVTCHNARLKTGGLVIDPATVNDAAGTAEAWEKVVRKLRTGAMPPAGHAAARRATYESLATTLEAQLDRAARGASATRQAAAGASPEPHRVPERHPRSARRSRRCPTRCASISCCPPTTSAAASTTSPICCSCRRATLERYLDAATKDQPPRRRRPDDAGARQHPQARRRAARRTSASTTCRSARAAALAVRSDFPVDGDLHRQGGARRRAARSHTSSRSRSTASACGASADAGAGGGRGGRGGGAPTALEFPLPIKAGRGWSASRS